MRVSEPRSQAVLEAIREYRRSHPRQNPTVRELCRLAGIQSTSLIRFYLKKLERDGWIDYIPRISRGIILNDTRPTKFLNPPKLTRKERAAILGEL